MLKFINTAVIHTYVGYIITLVSNVVSRWRIKKDFNMYYVSFNYTFVELEKHGTECTLAHECKLCYSQGNLYYTVGANYNI